MKLFSSWNYLFRMALILTLLQLLVPNNTWAQPANYQRIVVLSDLHLPIIPRLDTTTEQVQEFENLKQEVIDDVNSWDDVSLITVTGDILASFGTEEEYAAAKKYFQQIHHPIYYMTGNHDYIYKGRTAEGKFLRGNAEERRDKLERFTYEFKQQKLYSALEQGGYLLIFLSVDSLDSKFLCEISQQQLQWLKEVLASHPHQPTLIFFHAPLAGTLEQYNTTVNTPSFIAQPETEIHELLQKNPQVILWVSGHTHTPATNTSFAAPVNLYDERVHNIHNSNLDRKTIWTNSIYLYPDKIVVKTFQHRDKIWLEPLERTFLINK